MPFLFQDYILHNVMSVFTFVGSGLLAQDDSHSLHVITHTITTIIPALLQVFQVDFYFCLLAAQAQAVNIRY